MNALQRRNVETYTLIRIILLRTFSYLLARKEMRLVCAHGKYQVGDVESQNDDVGSFRRFRGCLVECITAKGFGLAAGRGLYNTKSHPVPADRTCMCRHRFFYVITE